MYEDDHAAPIEFAKPPIGEVVNTFADWSEDARREVARRKDEESIAKVMATTGIDRAGAEQALIDGKRLAAEIIKHATIAEQTRHDVAASVARHDAIDPVTITLEEPQEWDEILNGPPLGETDGGGE